ncbi:hypothetical protein COS31_02125 [Candidatus Roizmanbacteria bacterium CG02_land_8_20_14_3_00_36_15]|uniref:DUF4012 domain-containing protein n=2 Tax=Candidatus Roizmaniibacteriota TaxID=1752723 RepID=A0A2M8KLX9_9BACT|nr:MAG: hypothetical protein COS31_02125 [Candidatus Roizmanbacteria bacterium CG02_land_8_20_14_3_00_36_15]PIY70179.1 MAG: hypothetical protein COY89_02445 [Candidatus Roizmanbacteria bacterium CG_4_10_14_0_8_um_filter_36_36]PJC81670.1 MAG: hypothetical protein CO007_03210 [Candidatus Roizmanbacteria bacterium CG_4_8_14_3_um_filter_36_10]PJE60900.1 MAG: hypothetical protein COU86_02220 [Candidatus Roizmanbacteria bacterium CG10_big_fil_rev_8_21_14_0_10_36_26]
MLLRQSYRRKKNLSKIIIVFFIFFLFLYLFIYRPLRAIETRARQLYSTAKELKTIFSQNDIDLLNKQFDVFSSQYQDFQKQAKSIYWLSFIPYFADFKNGVEAGSYLVKAGKETIEAITPYADLIGFKKGEVSFVEKSAEDRLQTALLTLDKVLTKIDPISEDINQAETRIGKINSDRYPQNLGKTEIRKRIINLKEQFKGLASLFVDAKPLLKRLPDILGKDGERTYLILFQNDKELRASGGFLTAYAVFTIKDGKMKITQSDDIYSLDNSITVRPEAPTEILTYHLGVSQFYIRDSNLSPDFAKSIELFNSLYKKSSARVDYDGIIALDSKVLVDMLTIFGDTEASGVRFSANKDSRCDCPQVLYQLFDMVDRPVNYVKENRKGILGDLMYALFYKAIGFSPSKYWGTLSQTMFKNLQEKHILIYLVDQDLQQAIEKLNFSGKIKNYSGDYLHVNDVNFAGAKSNMFVSESISSVTKKEGSKIVREITIDYRNPYPHSDCSLERGGLCLNATLRDWLRIYVPQGSKLIGFEGSSKKVQTYDSLGKTVFEGFLTVVPQGMAKIIIRYSLPEKVDVNQLLIQKQPGTYENKLVVEINGRKLYSGGLDVDKEIR